MCIESTFLKQLSLYPQEKIHVQTDRNVYTAGETIWFRAHLVDALLLKQANASRYIYLDLINPLDDIIQTIKIRPDDSGCFYGHFLLDEDLAEGSYSLRAYTRFMQNQGDDYFFYKSIYVTDPMIGKLSPEIRFFKEDKEIKAEFSFKKDDEQITPKQSSVCYDQNTDKNGIALTFKDNVGCFTFKEKQIKKNRIVLLQAVFDNGVYKRYLTIPNIDKDFDVSFFPEGGHAPYSTDVKMAFKSLNDCGLSEEIKGEVFDDLGELYTTFETTHLGMGNFNMCYSPDRKYHAICTNSENVSKRFDLPEATLDVVSLATLWMKNYLRVSMVKS
ncbi:MAG: MG2 domain-containing protein, partial [Phocaeicola sp.]